MYRQCSQTLLLARGVLSLHKVPVGICLLYHEMLRAPVLYQGYQGTRQVIPWGYQVVPWGYQGTREVEGVRN